MNKLKSSYLNKRFLRKLDFYLKHQTPSDLKPLKMYYTLFTTVSSVKGPNHRHVAILGSVYYC